MIIVEREISSSQPPYIIAELGAAHNGLLDRALTLMEYAKRAGADCFKIQAFAPETITFDGAGDEFVIRDGPWLGRQLWDLYSACAMPREWYPAIFDRSIALGIPVIASVFSREDIAWMQRYECWAYKLASFELIDHDLIAAIAETGKPAIFSTGMAISDEIYEAHEAFVDAGGDPRQVALLHCVSEYPAPPERANLKRMERVLWQPFGLSDHTIGIEAAVAATALGARIIEKHITISRDDGGPDDGFAATPDEFAAMVQAVRNAHAMCQTVHEPLDVTHRPLRRSLYAVADIQPGERFTRDNVRSIRPGKGLHPKHLPTVLDRVSKVAVKAGTPMSLEFVESI